MLKHDWIFLWCSFCWPSSSPTLKMNCKGLRLFLFTQSFALCLADNLCRFIAFRFRVFLAQIFTISKTLKAFFRIFILIKCWKKKIYWKWRSSLNGNQFMKVCLEYKKLLQPFSCRIFLLAISYIFPNLLWASAIFLLNGIICCGKIEDQRSNRFRVDSHFSMSHFMLNRLSFLCSSPH